MGATTIIDTKARSATRRPRGRPWWRHPLTFLLVIALAIPLIDLALPDALDLGDPMRTIFLFAILGLGLNIITGFTGLLNLGVAAFMAIGVYVYAIATVEIYPFQLGFVGGTVVATAAGALAGFFLGAPTLRLRGDYLAIVTLGFGEIAQDVLKNLDSITKGTQGINPLPPPSAPAFLFGGYTFGAAYQPWYYLYLAILALAVIVSRNLERSRVGRAWISIREDELASGCMGINPVGRKLTAFAAGAAFCSLAGALWASQLGSTGEPANYDFSISILALCIVIVGGMGSIPGVLVGALVMIGLNSIVLVKLSDWMQSRGWASSANVLSTPTNWKFMLFGLALVLMMRFRPEGLLPSGRVKAELHHDEEIDDEPAGDSTPAARGAAS
ncbi:MAG: branched-chain amino acid ABC transporter permease [Phycisphaerales bacterium]